MNAGLRERKKLKTRVAIQREAMRLFLERGFEETTVEDVAAAVEISPSTFFNYFPSKEAVVFEDDLDPLILAAFDALPATMNPVARLRAAMKTVFSQISGDQDTLMRQRVKLMAQTPGIRSAMLGQFAELADQIADLLMRRIGNQADQFVAHNIAGAVLGVLMAAMITIGEDPKADMVQVTDEALAHLEAGLPVRWPKSARR